MSLTLQFGPTAWQTFFESALVSCLWYTRKIGASKELSRKEREAEERENGIGGSDDDDDDGMDI